MLQLIDGIQQFLIPVFAKTTNQWVAQELIKSQVLLNAFGYSHLADSPAIVVQTYKSFAKAFLTDRIKRTTYRLAESGLTRSVSLFQSTKATVFYVLHSIIIGKDAILTPDDTRHEITLLIRIGHALLIDYSLSRGREIAPNSIQTILDFSDFIKRDRCPSITLHTAFALADTEVTTELLRQNL